MLVQYCSDLHLEFKENNRWVLKNSLTPKGEILLLAGDVLPLALDHAGFEFFDVIADNFEAVYWVPGNHEYYGFDMAKTGDVIYEKIRSNVFLLNNTTVHYKDVNIVCSTLWSRISPLNELAIQKSLADFFAIYYQDSLLFPARFNQLHELSLAFIKDEMNKYAGAKNIVLSHHVPTFKNYPPKYIRSILSEAFAVELFDYISYADIAYWLYGHHHSNVPPFKIGDTMLLTNQLGYVKKHEHHSYKRDAVFEI